MEMVNPVYPPPTFGVTGIGWVALAIRWGQFHRNRFRYYSQHSIWKLNICKRGYVFQGLMSYRVVVTKTGCPVTELRCITIDGVTNLCTWMIYIFKAHVLSFRLFLTGITVRIHWQKYRPCCTQIVILHMVFYSVIKADLIITTHMLHHILIDEWWKQNTIYSIQYFIVT